MRPAMPLRLFVLGVVLAGVRTSPALAARAEGVADARDGNGTNGKAAVVKKARNTGETYVWKYPDEQAPDEADFHFGKDKKAAKEVALDAAQKRLKAFLEAHQPPIQWLPSPAYIEKHLLKEEVYDDKSITDGVRIKFLIAMTPKDYEEVLHHDRQLIAQQRQFEFFKGLLVVVTVLAAVGGYYGWAQRAKAPKPARSAWRSWCRPRCRA